MLEFIQFKRNHFDKNTSFNMYNVDPCDLCLPCHFKISQKRKSSKCPTYQDMEEKATKKVYLKLDEL